MATETIRACGGLEPVSAALGRIVDDFGELGEDVGQWCMGASIIGNRGLKCLNLIAVIRSISEETIRVQPWRSGALSFDDTQRFRGFGVFSEWSLYRNELFLSYVCGRTFDLASLVRLAANTESISRMSQIACALESYRINSGRFPEKLANLTGLLEGGVPVDAFTGNAYAYHLLSNNEYTLESTYLDASREDLLTRWPRAGSTNAWPHGFGVGLSAMR